MPDPSLGLRVERLLSGNFRTADLIMLFLASREICGGRESVKEVGDFVAHKTQRTRGATTRELRNFMTDLRFKYLHWDSFVPMDDLPTDFADIIERSLNRAEAQQLKAETGLVPATAKKTLPVILARLKSNNKGGLILEKPSDETEQKLVSYLVTFARVRPAFTADRLYKEFVDTLLVNDLLAQIEVKSFAWTKPLVALFAIEHLHGSSILLEDESVMQLRATAYSDPYNGERTLGVGGYMIIPRKNDSGEPLRVLHGSAVFTTQLYADDWCDETLTQRPFAPWWSAPIELTNQRKLSRISSGSQLSFP
jgi:hypothetical protein